MSATREGSDCSTGKVQWTRDGAKEARDRAKRQGRRVRDYHCERCGLWHLGHTKRSDKKRAVLGR